MEMNPEVAVLICRDPLFSPTKTRGQSGTGDRTTAQTPTDVAKLREEVLVAGRMRGPRLPEHTADEKDLCPRAVASVGFENDPALASSLADRAHNKT
jgi:hypothetical protein